MSQTVIALFNDSTAARNAVETLTGQGFQRSNVDISDNNSNTSSYNDPDKDTNESGISRFFNSLFGDNDESNKYTKVAEKNNCVVTVHVQSHEEAQRAAEILDGSGAMDVDKKAEEYGYGTTNANLDKSSMDTRSGHESTSIPVVEENVQIGKREIETGGVRLKSRIVEKPVEENLRLREERVTVERTPVDRKATDEDLDNLQDKEIEVVEHAEIPIVSKEARVVEEVKLNKEIEHRDETVKETARKTEVDVENIEGKEKSRRRKN